MKKPGEIVEREINKEFTDRDESRAIFWDWYEKSKSNLDDFFVLSYYGIGGIGKSSLVDQLCRELTKKSGLFIKYDFEYTTKGIDPFDILLGIKNTIRSKYSFRFPLFNASLIVLAKRTGVDFENDEVVKSIITESPHLQNAVNALSLLPVVGGYFQNVIIFTSQLYADIDNIINDKQLNNKYRRYIQEMTTLEADELRANMPLYFWNDMTENVKHCTKPFVIFLDTYEKYIDTFKATSNVVLDSWLRESTRSLIQRIPGILWVISGRDKLTWKNDGEWDEEHLGCYEVRDFLDLDSVKYLQKAGITEKTLVKHICELTKGVPIYLDLCVDTYYLLLDKGITPSKDNFEVDHRKIVNRYIKYLDDANRDLVYMLAAMGVWKDEEAEYVGEHISSISFSEERYTAMVQHSFFVLDENGRRKIHSIVAQALKSELSDLTMNRINGLLFHFRVEKINNRVLSSTESVAALCDAIESFCNISVKDFYPDQYNDFRKLTELITELTGKGVIYNILSIGTKLNEYCAKRFRETKYHGDSLEIYSKALTNVSRYEEALFADRLSHTIRKRLLGKDHPDTLRSLHYIGVDYSNLGRYKEALETDKRAYEARRQVLGVNHPDTLSSLNSIGVDYGNLGRYEDALETDKQVYKACKQVLGEDHPDTLNKLNNIGVDYSNLGWYEEALEIDKQVYEALSRVLGKNHPDTLGSLYSIGVDCSNLGRYKEALEIDKQVYEALSRVLGKNHPKTLDSLNNIGVIYRKIGWYKEALHVSKEVYESYKQVLGKDHPSTLNSLSNMGMDYNCLGLYEEALHAQQQSYEARKRVLGENHPDTLNSLTNVSVDYSSLGRDEEALEIDKQVYEASRRVLGENHPDTLGNLNNIGVDYRNLCRYTEALHISKEAYESYKRVLGEDHPDTLNSLYNVSVNYSHLERYEEALEISKQVYEARKRVLGEDHPDTLSSLHSMGDDYSNLGRYEDALKIDNQIFEIYKRVLGEDHPDTLNRLNIVSVDYSNLGRYEEALEIDKQIFKIRKRVLGENHPDTLNSLNNITIDYSNLGRNEDEESLD